ncbi:bone morphogenetic protein 10-like [Arapaima gigas]
MAIVQPSRFKHMSILSLVLLFLLAHKGHGHPTGDAKVDSEPGQHLGTFNLTSLRPQRHQAPATPTEDMLELYKRFTSNSTAGPPVATVRSFYNQDSSNCSVSAEGIRTHPLLFNVSIPDHEQIASAELHLHAMMQQDLHLYTGQDRRVTIYEIREDGSRRKKNCRSGKEESGELAELESWWVSAKDHIWKAFDLTDVVRCWSESKHTPQRLEVHIASLPKPGETRGIMFSEETKANGNFSEKPTSSLIVFSNDRSRKRRIQKRSRDLMPGHVNQQNNQDTDVKRWSEDKRNQDEEPVIEGHSKVIYDTASRVRRSAKESPCRVASLYVDFKDIGWDSWILAPRGYEAYKCSGTCSYPLLEPVTPTKHAIVQTLVNLNSPERASRACCVPTKLKPISLLYMDDTGVVTYKAKYDNMVVAECGCR